MATRMLLPEPTDWMVVGSCLPCCAVACPHWQVPRRARCGTLWPALNRVSVVVLCCPDPALGVRETRLHHRGDSPPHGSSMGPLLCVGEPQGWGFSCTLGKVSSLKGVGPLLGTLPNSRWWGFYQRGRGVPVMGAGTFIWPGVCT